MNTKLVVTGVLDFILAVSLVPIVIRVCGRWKLFDQPGDLKIHQRPIPRLGGVALFLAFAASLFISSPGAAAHAWPFFAALALVWITSLIDDLRGLSASFRLAAQIAAGAILCAAGWRVPLPAETSLIAAAVGVVATCLLVAAFVNATNFLDGSDGVAAGVASIIGVAYVFLPAQHARPLGSCVACGLVGACLGFLCYNFPFPAAKIFMGDSGSATLGFCLAFLGLDYWRSQPTAPAKIAFPVLVAALPLLDAALAIVRRISSGASPLYGDRRHVYDLIFSHGWSPRKVALTCYAITAIFAAIAYWGVRRESPHFWVAAGLAVLSLLVGCLKLGSLRTAAGRLPQIDSRVVSR